MSIREYLNENGTKLFKVNVHCVSSKIRGLRIQKQASGIKTYREATKMEKSLTNKIYTELNTKENQGESWKTLVMDFEVALENGTGSEKAILPTTINDNIKALETHTKDWMTYPASSITPGDVRKLLREMEEKGYSASRRKAIKSAISSAFKWGIQESRIRGIQNPPTMGISFKRDVDNKPPQILNHKELCRLLECARDMEHEWYPVWTMATLTGMRSGELMALEWTDVDLEGKLLTVSKSYNGRMKQTKSTKAGYWRKVPVNAELEALLIDLRAKAQGSVHVLPRLPGWRRGEAARILREFCVGIGINSICFHALRACFATHLLSQGVSSPVVKKICGWTDEKVMTRYIRLAGIDVAGATDTLVFVKPRDALGKIVLNMGDFRRNL